MNYYIYTITQFLKPISYFIGDFDSYFLSLLAFIIINITLYTTWNFTNHTLTLGKCLNIIECKIIILILVALANILDTYVLKDGSTIRVLTILFYISNEGTNIFIHVELFGVPVPQNNCILQKSQIISYKF